MELDPEMVAKIQAKARADRAIVDRYNATWLRDQGIEPTPELLQEYCDTNVEVALREERARKRMTE